MLHYLSGGSENDPAKYYGNKILDVKMADERLTLKLSSGVSISIWDNGQSCCESRYMKCDDDINSLVGHELRRIDAKDGPDASGEYDVHEQVFVEIGTDVGFITICNHNEHNGYYGGFGLTITEEKD